MHLFSWFLELLLGIDLGKRLSHIQGIFPALYSEVTLCSAQGTIFSCGNQIEICLMQGGKCLPKSPITSVIPLGHPHFKDYKNKGSLEYWNC